jgi:RNA polymerase sigma-70 factor (ECF subfamily)
LLDADPTEIQPQLKQFSAKANMTTIEKKQESDDVKGGESTQAFDRYRGLLFSIAYRILGSATDAEDVVQEAFVRWLQADSEQVQSPRAYLSTIVVRLCIDQLRSARAQRDVYVGPWLPEPILTGQRPDLTDTVVLAESLSFAFLVMLESLGPLERAVFLLRDVFDYDFAEIGAIVGKSGANCRQILHRARQHLGERRRRFEVNPEQQERITEQFLRASTRGDLQGLLGLLTDDIVFAADSGGKARAGLKPVHGPDKVARGLLGGLRWLPSNARVRIDKVNGQPAIVADVDHRPYGAVILEIEADRIRRIYAVLNPDKLRWLDGSAVAALPA